VQIRRNFVLWPILLMLLGSAVPVGAAVSARDDTGQVTRLARPARRVVSLAPSTTEALFAIGAGPRLVGVSSFDDYPPAAKKLPKMGTFSGPDLERIVAAKPDLVVAAHGNPLDLIRRLRSRKIPVYVTNPLSIDAVLENMLDLGRLTGRDAAARRLVQGLRERLRRVAERVARRPAVNALVVIWDEPLTVAGGKSFIQDILRRAGGVNAARSITETYPKLDPERLLLMNPAVVLYPVGGEAARLKRLKERAGFRQTTAARTGRVHSLNPDWLMRPGPRMVQGVEMVARLLHPEAF
jgi:iron complex transport system substrate-binding protein